MHPDLNEVISRMLSVPRRFSARHLRRVMKTANRTKRKAMARRINKHSQALQFWDGFMVPSLLQVRSIVLNRRMAV